MSLIKCLQRETLGNRCRRHGIRLHGAFAIERGWSRRPDKQGRLHVHGIIEVPTGWPSWKFGMWLKRLWVQQSKGWGHDRNTTDQVTDREGWVRYMSKCGPGTLRLF